MARVSLPDRTPLRCFVAMAFGHRDTDQIYSVIKRSLAPIPVATRRVDRIEHNDDIDDRIIDEIKKADLVIADLTYARPSVYFEAGYAQRVIPVVYTVRSDHFHARDTDPHGNRQVHFDLKMRNIVGWSSPKDLTFPRRLKARIIKVVGPLVRRRNDRQRENALVGAFEKLSQKDKRQLLLRTGKEYFRKLGYRIIEPRRLVGDGGSNEIVVAWQLEAGLGGTFAAIRHTRNRFHCVFFQSTPSIDAKLCDAYRATFIWHQPYSVSMFLAPKTIPSRLREDVIICSLGSNGLRRLRTNIPLLRAGEVDQTLIYDADLEIPRRGENLTVPRDVTFHVFESAQRLARLPEELKERFSRRDPLVQHQPSRPLPSSRQRAPHAVVLKPLVVKVRPVGSRIG
jgi:nucleoside 2-deoxyribosyltransferase